MRLGDACAIRCGVMNWFCVRNAAARLGVAGLAVAAWLLTACGKEEKAAPTATAAAEVRGEPIRGEPIAQAPAAEKSADKTPEASAVTADKAPEVPAAPAPIPVAVATASTAPDAAGAIGAAKDAAGSVSTPEKAVTTESAGAGTPESPLIVGFDKLASFKYDLPDGQVDTNTVAQTGAANQIPATIKALNNQFVSLKGFMLPLKVEKGLVTELLMMRDQSMCCYGTVPRINEWVSVKMVGAGVKPIMDQAVTLFGKLKVGEMYENGYLVGIYSLDGERMAGPLDM